MLKFLQKHPRKCFALDPQQSPTYFNLHRYLQEQGWRPCSFSWQADFSHKNFQFNLAATQCLEFKHLLTQLTDKYNLNFIPVSYCINDLNWPIILDSIANRYYVQHDNYCDQVADLAWILKPALLNNGQEIRIFSKLSELEAHFLSSKRLGGEHVLQKYLGEPHLLRPPRGHKYSIRMFIVLTNYAGCYLYPYGYFNVALHPFKSGKFTNLRCHLTNEHLHEEENNVVQIPSERFDFFNNLYPQIKSILSSTLKSLQQEHSEAFLCARQRNLAIFGFDFMVDKDQRVWLLEANHGPCFPKEDEHPLQKHLYYNFWQAFIKSFVLPIANHVSKENITYELFEEISIS